MRNEKKTSTMRAVRMTGFVNEDHTLRLDLPTHVEEGPAEVIVLVQPSSVLSDVFHSTQTPIV